MSSPEHRGPVPTRRSPRDGALALLGMILAAIVWLGLALAIHQLHCLGHEPLPGLATRSNAAGLLMYLPLLLASLPAGLLLSNAIAHVLPFTRRALDRDAERRGRPGYADSQRGLLKAVRIILAVALPLSLAGALLPL